MDNLHSAESSQIIDRLGGTSAVATMCEINPASVSEWRRKDIPKARLMYLRVIRPEAFPETEEVELPYSATGT